MFQTANLGREADKQILGDLRTSRSPERGHGTSRPVCWTSWCCAEGINDLRPAAYSSATAVERKDIGVGAVHASR
ncbi:hypothetical protein ACFWAY_07085 [Rhodococcus sp. NPDC059968]|uniref:hypothetical protein n=1 Tax=Rhodococcus sp. NPDC059968 TaxID=3347017 RepID=UPI003672406E